MFTSKELSKKLADNGCELESDELAENDKIIVPMPGVDIKGRLKRGAYFKYDILNDICLKHAKEFFGKKKCTCSAENKHYNDCRCGSYDEWSVCFEILRLLKNNKIKEAEDYIWEYCKFNPKNK